LECLPTRGLWTFASPSFPCRTGTSRSPATVSRQFPRKRQVSITAISFSTRSGATVTHGTGGITPQCHEIRLATATGASAGSCASATRYQNAALDQLRHDGHNVHDDDVRRLLPLGHDHINLLGRYQFSATDITDGQLRPLRDPAAPET